MGKILNLKQAAEMLGTSSRTVLNLIQSGDLAGFRVGNVWKIEEDEVRAYIQRQKEKAKRQVA